MKKIRKGEMYFRNLDASRFFAFLLVFPAHCFISTDPHILSSPAFIYLYNLGKTGVLGLEYFFVLSSFLISYLILEEWRSHGSFSIRLFLIRRALRVWPLYFLILIIGYLAVLLATSSGIEVRQFPGWPWLFFFMVNYYIILQGQEFLFFIVFLWSISVEEQFYLSWSILMKYLHRRFDTICLTLIVFSVLFRLYYQDDSTRLYFDTLSALGNFGVGGLLASSVFKKRRFITRISDWPRPATVSVYILLILSIAFFQQLIMWEPFHILSRLYFSLLFSFVIINQGISRSPVLEFSKFPLAEQFGKISYGLYCYHGLVITLMLQFLHITLHNQTIWMVILVIPCLILGLTVLLSQLSYRFFEVRFLDWKKSFYPAHS